MTERIDATLDAVREAHADVYATLQLLRERSIIYDNDVAAATGRSSAECRVLLAAFADRGFAHITANTRLSTTAVGDPRVVDVDGPEVVADVLWHPDSRELRRMLLGDGPSSDEARHVAVDDEGGR